MLNTYKMRKIEDYSIYNKIRDEFEKYIDAITFEDVLEIAHEVVLKNTHYAEYVPFFINDSTVYIFTRYQIEAKNGIQSAIIADWDDEINYVDALEFAQLNLSDNESEDYVINIIYDIAMKLIDSANEKSEASL